MSLQIKIGWIERALFQSWFYNFGGSDNTSNMYEQNVAQRNIFQ